MALCGRLHQEDVVESGLRCRHAKYKGRAHGWGAGTDVQAPRPIANAESCRLDPVGILRHDIDPGNTLAGRPGRLTRQGN
jgi:hypothetical protein